MHNLIIKRHTIIIGFTRKCNTSISKQRVVMIRNSFPCETHFIIVMCDLVQIYTDTRVMQMFHCTHRHVDSLHGCSCMYKYEMSLSIPIIIKFGIMLSQLW